ncbi:MAG: Tol-Pal system beta propeller repeat protein TolB [Deltaproteobacteria bacterium]|nr:Tol-Pal system beta propeller repeat protein TolB [Deltaproteobacteria bacterium]
MRLTVLITIATFLILPVTSHAGYEYIDITNPFFQKIPVAVPLFKAVSGDIEETRIASDASDLLADTLAFTGLIRILDRESFLVDSKTPISAPNINFQNWISIGAELLVTGGVRVDDKLMQMELRLYDTVKGRLLIGKRYKGWTSDHRTMVHRFCSEIIYSLTGDRGIFNTQIAFISTTTGNKELWLCEFDGYNPDQFTRKGKITLFPSWSSDGQWLAYTSYAKGKPDLYIEHVKKKKPGFFFAREGTNSTPAWVPWKFELAASLSFSGDQEIYLLTGRGKIIKRLTENRGIDVSPAWSPDGKKMAFVTKRSGTPQIYIRDFDTGRTERLTFHGKYNTQPSWSPLGDKIAFSAMEGGLTNIHVIGIDGNNQLQLTHDQGDNESPTWSPDGRLIAFSSTREGLSRIFIMSANGMDQRRLLTLPGQQSNPEWSPRGGDNKGD